MLGEPARVAAGVMTAGPNRPAEPERTERGSDRDGFQQGVLAKPAGLIGITGLGLYTALLAISVIEALLSAWPGGTGGITLLGGRIPLGGPPSPDVRLMLVALLSGALGAFVHAGGSLATYVGNRQMLRSWGLWYLLRPFIGAALGLILYFLLRGGLFAPGAPDQAVSPYGVAALAALAGMFSKEATDKLQQVFRDFFKPPEESEQRRADKLARRDAE